MDYGADMECVRVYGFGPHETESGGESCRVLT